MPLFSVGLTSSFSVAACLLEVSQKGCCIRTYALMSRLAASEPTNRAMLKVELIWIWKQRDMRHYALAESHFSTYCFVTVMAHFTCEIENIIKRWLSFGHIIRCCNSGWNTNWVSLHKIKGHSDTPGTVKLACRYSTSVFSSTFVNSGPM